MIFKIKGVFKKMKKNIFILSVVLCILIVSSTFVSASETIDVKDYIKGKFPMIFNIYLSSLEDLDSYEKEFIDLLQKLPKEEQEYYAKEVYKNGFSLELLEKLKKGETFEEPKLDRNKEKEEKVVVKTEEKIKVEDTFQWEQDARIIFTNTGEDRVTGDVEFFEEMHKTFPGISGWGRPSLLPVLEERLEQVMISNTVFMVWPENLTDLEKVEQKYPNLLPVTCSKLKSYSPPFFYFSRDKQTGKIRGVVISIRVYPSLANMLTKKVPLDTAFWYENGQLQILKKKTEEETAKSYQKKSLWEKKWAQEPAPRYSKHRVDNPKDYDVQGLRVNADFKVDVNEWWPNVEMSTYWVPAVALGTPDNTKEELLELKGQPEKAKEEINVLFEALAFIHLCTESGIHNAKTQGKNSIGWEFPKPAEPAIRDGTVNCASAANVIQYLLEDDYDEVGYVWRHSSFDSERVGGHCTSYIKENDKYYFFDPVSLAEERSKYPVEDGDGSFYEVDICDLIIQSTPRKYAIFWTQLSTDDEAIFAMFQSPYGPFALGNDGHNLYYPKAFDGANLKIWKDPADSVELLQASYNPKPPKNQYGVKNYADYMPYKNYEKLDKTEKQGEPEIATIPSDG